ncbi:unnamed protein product [Effrenium voratum]|uniref:Uncharacterized protein n=1 Tax=Effrenium voratum TaxID=2562239 RepID=A0AA36ISC0_9DINO|nr:unnamed protein product [Effrenium voratum]
MTACGWRTPPMYQGSPGTPGRMRMEPRVHPPVTAVAATRPEAFVQVCRWHPADSGAETSRASPGPPRPVSSVPTPSPGRLRPACSVPTPSPGRGPNLNQREPQLPLRFSSEPNRHELQQYVAQRVAQRKMEHVPSDGDLSALTPTSRKDACAELLEMLGAIAAAARRQTAQAAKVAQERSLAQDRLADCEAKAAVSKEELGAVHAELREAEALLRESQAEALAAKAEELLQLRAELQEEQRLSEQRQAELLRLAREAQEQKDRDQQQKEQIAELKERLQGFYEEQNHHQVAQLIQAAAQEVNLLPRRDSTCRQLFSPSLLTPASESTGSTFVFEEPAPSVPLPVLLNNAAEAACGAGALVCSPLSAAPSLKSGVQKPRSSLVSSLAPSSGEVVMPSPTESATSAPARLSDAPRPFVRPGTRGASPGASLYCLSSSASSLPQRSRSGTPHDEAPPVGCVAEKIIFFDRHTPSEPKTRPQPTQPVPTPLGRHLLPRASSPRASPTKCRRRLSYPEVQA